MTGFPPAGTACAFVLAFALAAPPSPAHGGVYRGPPPLPVVPPPGGPTTGGGAIPQLVRGPTTASVPVPSADPTSWQFWWEYNKDPFLHLRQAVHAPGGVRGSDEYFMGGQTADGRAASLAPSAEESRDRIVPQLQRLLASTSNKDVATACMIALAKIGIDLPDFSILQAFRERLARGNQEVRETAALCLGISQRREALDDLLPLALDEPRGRRLVDRSTVDARTRAFATYGLGQIAWAHGDLATKDAIYRALAGLLEDKALNDRDLQVAAIQSLGLLRPDPQVTGHKRLLWQSLDTLWSFYQRDLGKGDQVVQAHVPTAIARLLGRGAGADHTRYKRLLAAELGGSVRRHDSIYQSAVLALGAMALPAEVEPDDAAWSEALLTYLKRGKDQLARHFCLIALGEIGGDRNRSALLEQYTIGQKATIKPWAGLALGVLAFRERERLGADTGDAAIGQALLQGLRHVENEDHRAATAIALGLTGHRPAIGDLRRFLAKSKRREMLGGYLCIGLALLGTDEAVSDIRALVADSTRRPLLLTQSAIALGKLGDKDATELLADMLRDGDANLGKLSGIATAFRLIGDRRSIEPLAKIMFDENMTTLSRAFVAAALGGIGDKESEPWNSKLSVNTNYNAAVDTLTNGSTGVLDIL